MFWGTVRAMLLGLRLGWPWTWWPLSHQVRQFSVWTLSSRVLLWNTLERERGTLVFISARYSQRPGYCQGNGRSCFLGWPSRGGCSHHCSLSSSCDLEKAEVSSTARRVASILDPFLVSGRPSLWGLLGNREGCTGHSAPLIYRLFPHH